MCRHCSSSFFSDTCAKESVLPQIPCLACIRPVFPDMFETIGGSYDEDSQSSKQIMWHRVPCRFLGFCRTNSFVLRLISAGIWDQGAFQPTHWHVGRLRFRGGSELSPTLSRTFIASCVAGWLLTCQCKLTDWPRGKQPAVRWDMFLWDDITKQCCFVNYNILYETTYTQHITSAKPWTVQLNPKT